MSEVSGKVMVFPQTTTRGDYWSELLVRETNCEIIWSEQVANYLTHVIGFVFALIGLAVLFVYTQNESLLVRIGVMSWSGYVLCLGASALYHRQTSKLGYLWYQCVDHVMISIGILGTIVPLLVSYDCFVFYPDIIFGLVALTALNVLLHIPAAIKQKELSLVGYTLMIVIFVEMGGLVLASCDVSLIAPDDPCFDLTIYGALVYLVGLIPFCFGFYRKYDWFLHPVWHIFVLIGGGLHYAAILLPHLRF
jgi:hemolysin III